MGGGGLYGTAQDYLKFTQMILNDGRGNGADILKPATVQTMAQNQIGGILVGALKTAAPPLSNDVDVFPGMPKKWGLSFLINTEKAPTGRAAGSLAWAGLANTYFWIDRSTGIAGVYLTQLLPFADSKSLPLFANFETEVYRSLG
jgi:methyl acetate hydrolase